MFLNTWMPAFPAAEGASKLTMFPEAEAEAEAVAAGMEEYDGTDLDTAVKRKKEEYDC